MIGIKYDLNVKPHCIHSLHSTTKYSYGNQYKLNGRQNVYLNNMHNGNEQDKKYVF